MDNPFESLCSPQKIDQVIESTLKMTVNPQKSQLHFVQSDLGYFSLDLLEFSFFERLMACENDDQNKVMIYIHDSYQRVQKEVKMQSKSNDGIMEVLQKIQELIFRNISTFLKEPELVAGQDISQQFLEIYKETEVEDGVIRDQFLSHSILAALKDSDDSMKANVKEIFHKCFDSCLKIVRQANMITLEKWIMTFLMAFVGDKNNCEMASMFLDYIELPDGCDGLKYSDSLLGKID